MALVFRTWIWQSCGNGLIKAEIGWDDVSLAVTRVRYSLDSTDKPYTFSLFKPASEAPDGTPLFGPITVPPGTPTTTRNIQNLGLTMMVHPRYPDLIVPNDWTTVEQVG
jgi:hypothetical protein